MSDAMPDPMPLDMPTGDPAAVDDVARDVDGAAYRLAALADELSGPAGSAPGWLGADATAAVDQLVRVTDIARAAAGALGSATGRLRTHGDLLRDTRREVAALREEQAEDHRLAWQRLSGIDDPRLAVMTGSSAWIGVVDDFRAAEARRRRRHTVLLEELAVDAAATARALADACRPVGGTGRPGDDGRVLAHLAAELPGWGDPELARRGRALADALMGRLMPEERAQLAQDARPMAGHPAFATAFLREAGAEEFGLLLDVLGNEPDGPHHPLAAVLAAALGAAVPTGRPGDRATGSRRSSVPPTSGRATGTPRPHGSEGWPPSSRPEGARRAAGRGWRRWGSGPGSCCSANGPRTCRSASHRPPPRGARMRMTRSSWPSASWPGEGSPPTRRRCSATSACGAGCSIGSGLTAARPWATS